MTALSRPLIPKFEYQHAFFDARTRILILSDNPGASREVATSLRQLGFDILMTIFDGSKLTSLPVEAPNAILCHLTDYIDKAPDIAKVLRKHFSPRQLPVIGALSRPASNLSNSFDSTLLAPMHASQIANRVGSMIRLGRIEAEITRRMTTLQEDFNEAVELSDMSPERQFRVLFIGKADPSFMVIINALQHKGVEVVAAFTSFSAFDYLHERSFDAVIMNTIEQSEPALSISEAMRKNSKLYHVPTLFLIGDGFADAETAYQCGARDLISVNANPDEISGRILELANYHRIHEQMKTEMFSIIPEHCRDGSGTVFSYAFFERHLGRVISDAQKANETVTLLGLKLLPESVDGLTQDDLDVTYSESAAIIKDVLRMHDIISRQGDKFYMAFYDTDEHKTAGIRDRLKALLEDNAFSFLSDNSALLTLSCQSVIYPVQPTDNAEKALSALISELETSAV